MRRTVRMGAIAALLIGIALVGVGCVIPTNPVPIDEVTAPRSFDFSTTKDVTVKVTVVDADGNVTPGSLITVGSTEHELVADYILTRGITNDQGQFEEVVRIPARLNALRVRGLIEGVGYRTDATIKNNEVSVSVGPVS
jgi:hypothetical protein